MSSGAVVCSIFVFGQTGAYYVWVIYGARQIRRTRINEWPISDCQCYFRQWIASAWVCFNSQTKRAVSEIKIVILSPNPVYRSALRSAVYGYAEGNVYYI